MFILYFLLMCIGLGNSQQVEFSQVLGRMETTMSTLNLRLARIEARQTRNMFIYSRLENNIKDVKTDLNSKHGETMLWLKNTVNLLNDLKVKDDRLEKAQKTMNENIQRLINKTNDCCRNDTIIVKCPSQTIVSTMKPVTSSSTATLRLTTPTSTSTSPTTTSPKTAPTTTSSARTSCKSVNQGGNVKDGVYQLDLPGNRQVQVYCSAGYVTIQRRFSGVLSFDRTFAEYEQGFGKISGEHWLGLSDLYELTRSGSCVFRVLLDLDNSPWNTGSSRCGDQRYTSDCDGKTKEILTDNFRISPASDLYRIQVAFNSTDLKHPDVKRYFRLNGAQFSTKDKGPSDCAGSGVVPGGFWYNSGCYPGRPNHVWTTPGTNDCSSSNNVCGLWWPYHFTSSWIQFSC